MQNNIQVLAQAAQMRMLNIKFTHTLKKTISYQKVISTENPFSNITGHWRHALVALRAHTLPREGQTLGKENKHLVPKGLQD